MDTLKPLEPHTLTLFKSRYSSYLILSAKIFISAGLIWYLLSKINISEIVSSLNDAVLPLIIISSAMLVLNICLQYWKWSLTCRFFLEERDSKKIFYSLLYGFSAGAFTPFRIGEYLGRAMVLKNNNLLQVTAATLADKFFSFIILAFTGAVSAILFLHFYYNVHFYLTSSLFMLLFILFYILIVFLISPGFWEGISSWFMKYKWLNEICLRLSVLKNLDKNFILKILVASFLFYFCYLIQYVLFVAGFSGNYNMINYLWAGSLMIFSKSLVPPVTLSELGIREGASIFFLTKFGESASVAFNASIFLFIVNLLIPALIGLFLFLNNSSGEYFKKSSGRNNA